MTHVFPIRITVRQCWRVLYSEYLRLSRVLNRPPYEFQTPKHALITDYTPQDGDEIIIYFRDADLKRTLLVVEVEEIPDENGQLNVFVHPRGNSHIEPYKSAMTVWRQVKKALEKVGRKSTPLKRRLPKKKRGMHPRTALALEKLRQMRIQSVKNNTPIITRKAAAKMVGIAINTWRNNDRDLWDGWEQG